ncbi:MAG: hypothetical protein Q4D17_11010, partial [Planctomycetia bacterium]|nr:hypothetical protein [Planctomycetia bacterium]
MFWENKIKSVKLNSGGDFKRRRQNRLLSEFSRPPVFYSMAFQNISIRLIFDSKVQSFFDIHLLVFAL